MDCATGFYMGVHRIKVRYFSAFVKTILSMENQSVVKLTATELKGNDSLKLNIYLICLYDTSALPAASLNPS